MCLCGGTDRTFSFSSHSLPKQFRQFYRYASDKDRKICPGIPDIVLKSLLQLSSSRPPVRKTLCGKSKLIETRLWDRPSPALCTYATDKLRSWPWILWIKSKDKHSSLHAKESHYSCNEAPRRWMSGGGCTSWADIIKPSDNHCLLLLCDSVSTRSLFLRFCKRRPVYCLRYNRVHPVFLLKPRGAVNSAALLCGQPVQFTDTVCAVCLKVNVRQSTDNCSKCRCLGWWHMLVVFVPVLCSSFEDSGITAECRNTVLSQAQEMRSWDASKG